MTFIPRKTAIVGATGPTGVWLARELAGRGRALRLSSRSLERLEGTFASLQRQLPELEIELVEADALEPGSLPAALEGCELMVDCIGLPADAMDDHVRVARNLADACNGAGVRAVQVSSYWAFLPTEEEVIDESHPRQGGNRYSRARRQAEDVFLAAGAAVTHLPDFFGPEVEDSTVQMALADAAQGKAMGWIGPTDNPREAAYVPDCMRIVADLAEREEAYGEDWGLPGSGPITADQMAEIAGRHLGRTVKVSSAPPWFLKLMSVFSADLRSFMPMVPHYASPVRYDTSKLEGLLGPQETTPYEEAIPATLDWLLQKEG